MSIIIFIESSTTVHNYALQILLDWCYTCNVTYVLVVYYLLFWLYGILILILIHILILIKYDHTLVLSILTLCQREWTLFNYLLFIVIVKCLNLVIIIIRI